MPNSCTKRRMLSLGLLASLAGMVPAPQGMAASAPPDFSPSAETAWVGIGIGAFAPVPGSPQPVVQDPAHRYVPNNTPGEQPTQRISDIGNPNLKQWAKEVMKKDNDEVLAGKFAFTARAACQPGGVPGFLVLLAPGALTIVQSPSKVTMIVDGNAETRHIRLNAPHAANARPSWYGDSVGHYEGDTLVVDTIGLNDKTFLDNYRTPHSEKLHVTERYRVVDDGKALEVNLTVDDPGAFNAPWKAKQRYSRTQQGPLPEVKCSENNIDLFDLKGFVGSPEADKPDF